MTHSPRPDDPRVKLEILFAQRLLPIEQGDLTQTVAIGSGLASVSRGATAAAVLIGLVERPTGLNVILTRRADHLRRHSGQVAFPGGRIEPGETVVVAALREAQEEIGLDPVHVRPVGLGDRHDTVTGFAVVPVVAFIAPEAVILAQEAEVAEVFEAPFAWLMDAANYRRGSRLVGGVHHPFESLEHGDRLIWGATAGMLRALRDRVFGEDATSRQIPPLGAGGR